jgi:hypothetical protein
MRLESTCVVDPSRPCGGCSAPGPRQCPYLFLLDPEELAALAAARDALGEHVPTKVPR